jgi:GxxExxY protein
LTGRIIGAAIEVHRHLGPGLLESIYSESLQHELDRQGMRFVTEHAARVVYKGIRLRSHCRVDLVVEDRVVVETKCVAALLPLYDAQVIAYLKLTGCPVGLLINFNVPRLVDGVKRLINTKSEP